jgi:hypothetical protein
LSNLKKLFYFLEKKSEKLGISKDERQKAEEEWEKGKGENSVVEFIYFHSKMFCNYLYTYLNVLVQKKLENILFV